MTRRVQEEIPGNNRLVDKQKLGRVKLACKPGSVDALRRPAVIHLGRQLPAGSSDLPGSSASRAIAPLFGLAPDGVCPAVSVARNAVGSYPTVLRPPTLPVERAPFHHRLIRRPSRYKSETLRSCGRKVGRRPSAVCSLWHFPSPRGVRPLAGILLYGARTFLCASELRSDCPASFGVDYRIGKPGVPEL